MQGKLVIQCRGCGRKLDSELNFDTADADEDLGWRIIQELLRHRAACPFYGQSAAVEAGDKETGGVRYGQHRRPGRHETR